MFARDGIWFESHLGHSISAGQGLFVALVLTKLDFLEVFTLVTGAGSCGDTWAEQMRRFVKESTPILRPG